MTDPKRVVEAGYDVVAERFADWQKQVEDAPRLRYVDELLTLLPQDADVLELGCGAAVHSTRLLAERSRLTGVDISAAQIERAAARVPAATFVHADIATIDFPPESFDAVVSLYVFNHVPREELGTILRRCASWLRPRGWLLANFAARDVPAWFGEWLGTEMFFSGYDAERNRELLAAAGFESARDEVVVQREPGAGDVAFHWVLARAPR